MPIKKPQPFTPDVVVWQTICIMLIKKLGKNDAIIDLEEFNKVDPDKFAVLVRALPSSLHLEIVTVAEAVKLMERPNETQRKSEL